MILLLHGPDDYRREEKKRFITEEFLKKHPGTNREVFDFSEASSRDEFFIFAKASPLFDSAKLAIVSDIADAPVSAVKSLAAFSADTRTTVLISQRGKLAKGEYGFLLAAAKTQEFPLLEGTAWRAYASALAAGAGVVLSPGALTFLAGLYQGDSWRFATEMQKLAGRKDKAIEVADLARFGLEETPDIWQALMRFKKSSASARLAILDSAFHNSEPAAKLFNILSSVWQENTPRFAEYDLAIKTGKIDYEEALVDLAIA